MIGKLLLNAIAFYVMAYLMPGVSIAGVGSLIVVSVVWGVLSVLIKPLIILLTLPINFLTLGLFSLVINGAMLLLTARLVAGFEVEGWGVAIVAALVLSLVNMVLSMLR